MAEKKKCLATVKSQSELAPGIYSLWLAFPEEYNVAAMAKPGQFLSLYSDDGSRLLPRPISICEIDAAKRMIRLVYRVAGAGTLEFSGKQEGDTIAVPNDTTNEARALLLLQDQGLIKLKDGAGLTATKKDIVENKKDLAIKEIEAAQIPRSLKDVDIAVVNGNYALEAGLKVNKDALATEDADSIGAKTYGNVVAVKKGNEKTIYGSNKKLLKKSTEIVMMKLLSVRKTDRR